MKLLKHFFVMWDEPAKGKKFYHKGYAEKVYSISYIHPPYDEAL